MEDQSIIADEENIIAQQLSTSVSASAVGILKVAFVEETKVAEIGSLVSIFLLFVVVVGFNPKIQVNDVFPVLFQILKESVFVNKVSNKMYPFIQLIQYNYWFGGNLMTNISCRFCAGLNSKQRQQLHKYLRGFEPFFGLTRLEKQNIFSKNSIYIFYDYGTSSIHSNVRE